VTLPLTVVAESVNGAAVTVAGRFETSAAEDIYSFTVPSGGQALNLSVSGCPTASYLIPLDWRLLNAGTGALVARGGCSYSNLGALPAGDYQLVLEAGRLGGTYAVNLEAPQTFAAALPLTVVADTVNGTAATGAGRFETTASQDIYPFTVPSGSQSLSLNIANCPTSNYWAPLTWKLLDGSGAMVASGYCGFYALGTIAAGDYRLVVSAGGLAGTYALNLEAPQSFPATIPLTVGGDTINGTAVTGAGRFETTASQDIYTFTVPAGGQALNLNVAACPTVNYSTPLGWKLFTSTGATVASGGCAFYTLGTLAAGDYKLVVSAGGTAGTYTLNLEAPQTFT